MVSLEIEYRVMVMLKNSFSTLGQLKMKNFEAFNIPYQTTYKLKIPQLNSEHPTDS